ncbi:alpha/beta hydrolase [Streptomyces sp. NA02950]|uniref:alpha/beta fold hydrolase n=1 Tax=Streptomyces sp. NA02950 TaxID=2742137 RepID=UPI0015904E24|nr:alpha/beta hydrolase [Streptomyces sp. NA02950]QKV96526.1 alpha/beta hydrolase [Streptomyces sp. NA02950]
MTNEHFVFIPGGGGRQRLWRHQTAALAALATSEVMVLDRQATRAGMAGYDLARTPEAFSAAGHSLGGRVAQEVAAGAPDRVSRLFLCDTWARSAPGTIACLDPYAAHLIRDADGVRDAPTSTSRWTAFATRARGSAPGSGRGSARRRPPRTSAVRGRRPTTARPSGCCRRSPRCCGCGWSGPDEPRRQRWRRPWRWVPGG